MLHALTNRKPYSNVSVGLRAVAVLESVKGIVVLLVGFGVRALVHRNIEDSAEEITHFLHLNPEGKRSSVFLHLADRTTSKDLWLLAIGALVHSAIHFTEAYGLWHQGMGRMVRIVVRRFVFARRIVFVAALRESAQVEHVSCKCCRGSLHAYHATQVGPPLHEDADVRLSTLIVQMLTRRKQLANSCCEDGDNLLAWALSPWHETCISSCAWIGHDPPRAPRMEETMAHELPVLPYDYSALEPTIDAQTMRLHHDMHHGTYVKNLNAALEKYPELLKKSAEELLRDLGSIPKDIRAAFATTPAGT